MAKEHFERAIPYRGAIAVAGFGRVGRARSASNVLTRSAPRTSPDGFEPGSTIARELTVSLGPSTYNAQTRTIEAVFSTGARVRRWGIFEELAVSADAIDLSRVTDGQVRLLDHHNAESQDSVLGVVEQVWFEGGKLVGRIRFADTESGRKAEGMVSRGELTGVSVGYRVTTWSLTSVENDVEVWRAEKWELLEISLVSVPADPKAAVRSASVPSPADNTPQQENDDMRRNNPSVTGSAPVEPAHTPAPASAAAPAAPQVRAETPAPVAPVAPVAPAPLAPVADQAAERARSADIFDIGQRAGMDRGAIDTAIRSGTTVEAFRSAAFEHLATRANGTSTSTVRIDQDETETRMRHMTEALTRRIGGDRIAGEISEGARSFMRHSLAEMAAEVIGERTMPRTFAERESTLQRAFHTTSDFPIIFEGSINRVLQARYAQAVPTYRRIAARRNFVDFRPHDVVRVGDFPMLQPLGEAGEIKSGTFGESKETVLVRPYAVLIKLSRQMLVNDSLGALDQMLGSYGDTVARFEEQTFYAMFNSNPALKEDGKGLFHADHGNLANPGAAIDVASLGKGRAALRKQKNISGAVLDLAARILLVGPDKETEAEQITTAVQAQKAGDVNPFAGRLETVSTAQISGNAWHLFADPAVCPVFQWGLLDGYEAPRLRIENPFGTAGVGVSLEHDFGCGAVDFRGAYKNPGAA